MTVYVVSGLYYYNNNCFELDEMPIQAFKTLEEANDACKKEFKSRIEGSYLDVQCEEDTDIQCEEFYDENNCYNASVCNHDNGERVQYGVSKIII